MTFYMPASAIWNKKMQWLNWRCPIPLFHYQHRIVKNPIKPSGHAYVVRAAVWSFLYTYKKSIIRCLWNYLGLSCRIRRQGSRKLSQLAPSVSLGLTIVSPQTTKVWDDQDPPDSLFLSYSTKLCFIVF